MECVLYFKKIIIKKNKLKGCVLYVSVPLVKEIKNKNFILKRTLFVLLRVNITSFKIILLYFFYFRKR